MQPNTVALIVTLTTLLVQTQLIAETRLMSLGDSITKGAQSYSFEEGDFSASTYRLYDSRIPNDLRSYREHLHDLLTQTSCNAQISWTGSETLPGRTPANHEGHGGWRTGHVLRQIPTWLSQFHPDVLLLNIGTNDLIQGRSAGETLGDIAGILNRIDEYETAANTSVEVYIGNMVPIYGWYSTHDRNDNISDTEVRRSTLSESIKSLVLLRQSVGDKIELVDISSDFYVDESNITNCLTKETGNSANMMMTRCQAHQPPNSPDGVHPNLLGDNFIARKFFSALQRNPSICNSNTAVESVPNVSIEQPLFDNAILSETVSFYGSAFDASDSSIEDVYIYIRDRDQNSWKTIADTANITSMNDTDVNWTYSTYLPQGSYSIFIKAVNEEGAASTRFSRRFSTEPDDQPPVAEITYPTRHGALTAQNLTITGIANDAGGSGVSEVLVYIRNRDLKNWEVVAATATIINHMSGSKNWLYSVALTPGNYTVFVKVKDTEGNSSTTLNKRFRVQ